MMMLALILSEVSSSITDHHQLNGSKVVFKVLCPSSVSFLLPFCDGAVNSAVPISNAHLQNFSSLLCLFTFAAISVTRVHSSLKTLFPIESHSSNTIWLILLAPGRIFLQVAKNLNKTLTSKVSKTIVAANVRLGQLALVKKTANLLPSFYLLTWLLPATNHR